MIKLIKLSNESSVVQPTDLFSCLSRSKLFRVGVPAALQWGIATGISSAKVRRRASSAKAQRSTCPAHAKGGRTDRPVEELFGQQFAALPKLDLRVVSVAQQLKQLLHIRVLK